jgi:hypothetical protein
MAAAAAAVVVAAAAVVMGGWRQLGFPSLSTHGRCWHKMGHLLRLGLALASTRIGRLASTVVAMHGQQY